MQKMTKAWDEVEGKLRDLGWCRQDTDDFRRVVRAVVIEGVVEMSRAALRRSIPVHQELMMRTRLRKARVRIEEVITR